MTSFRESTLAGPGPGPGRGGISRARGEWAGRWRRVCVAICLVAFGGTGVRAADAAAGAVLRVCASTPDVESLVREVGGRRVAVHCFSKGPEDPHEIELKPSFSRELDRADLYVQVGLGIENAWLNRLMGTVRNEAVKPGKPGNLNLGAGVRPLEGEAGRSVAGSYHEEGNPHYLLDPVEGLKAARAIQERLAALRPAWAGEFATNYQAFRLAVGTALVGEACARQDDVEELALEFEALETAEAREAFRRKHALGGWLGELAGYRGRKIVGDHDLWPYFARRNGLEVLGYLEPSPGVPPTTKHLGELVEAMRREKVGVLLTAPYFEARHPRWVAEWTGARVVPMAHQTGGRKGTGTYLEMLRHNYAELLLALKEAK